LDNVIAIIPAAGISKRMGAGVDKQLLSLCGQAVLERSIRAVLAAKSVDGVILVVKPGEEPFFLSWSERFDGMVKAIVTGGAQRQESVRNGLSAVPDDADVVVVHDGARPLISPQLVNDVVGAARVRGAATLGVPVKDTVKKTGQDNQVIETVPRDKLWLVQTPQAFQVNVIKDAHRWAQQHGCHGTDDASLVEAYGSPVTMVYGSYENIKVTTPEDMILAEALLKAK